MEAQAKRSGARLGHSKQRDKQHAAGPHGDKPLGAGVPRPTEHLGAAQPARFGPPYMTRMPGRHA
jgi:hypothetical protein